MKVLDFGAVDELGFAAERGRLPDRLPSRAASTIGPVVELLALDARGLVPAAGWGSWLDLSILDAFGGALNGGILRWQGNKCDRMGILRSPAVARSDGELVAFSHAARECQGFRVWRGIRGTKETRYAPTQITCYRERPA